MWLILLLYFLYATIFVIGKFAMQVADPIFFAGVRVLCAGIISYKISIYMYPVEENSKLYFAKKSDWFFIFLLSLFNIYITNAGMFWGLQYLSAGKASFIYNLTPFFVLIFSAFIFHEKITMYKVAGMLIAFSSLAPILLSGQDSFFQTSFEENFAKLIVLCSTIGTSLGWVLMKFLVKRNFTVYFLNGISMIIGGSMCLVHSFLFSRKPFIMQSIQEFLFYMIVIMLIQNVIAYNLHAKLLQSYSATVVALLGFSMPLITLLISHVFLSEPITWMFLICSVGVAIGLLIFYKKELGNKLC